MSEFYKLLGGVNMNTLITFGLLGCIALSVIIVGFIIGKERREKIVMFCNK